MSSESRTFAFGTKGETLLGLSARLSKSYVLPALLFDVSTWRQAPDPILERVENELSSDWIVVRSSARGEDTWQESNAGRYVSVLNVPRGDRARVMQAIEEVIGSYPPRTQTASPPDQVLLQEQLAGVFLSGVLFTRDQVSLAPYRVFNYDDRSGQTDQVTSGRGSELRTYVRYRGLSSSDEPFPSQMLARVFAAAVEIEEVLATDRLDIELAVDSQGRVCIFQVRPIAGDVEAAGSVPERLSDAVVAAYLLRTEKRITELGAPHPYLHGKRTILGVMPDWNPAEMIGLRPRALALSLYKEVITDAIWAYQRDAYGYKNLRSFPLLVSLIGAPFIDVRVDFNSFVPRGVRPALAEKLVNYYLDVLEARPSAHDKVEFDVVFSCYFPGIRGEMERLARAGFTPIEIGELLAELRALTDRIIDPTQGLFRRDRAKLGELSSRRDLIVSSDMPIIDKIYWLVEDCKRYGTLPFSGIARSAFISVQFLRAFVTLGILTPEESQAFLRSLETVTRRMKNDLKRLGSCRSLVTKTPQSTRQARCPRLR